MLKNLFILALILGFVFTLSTEDASASNNSSLSQNNSIQSTVQPTNNTTASKQLTTNSTTVRSEGLTTTTSSNSTRTIRVLVYNGEYSIGVCVTGIIDALNTANSNNLAPGYHFSYATSTYINSAVLTNFDVLAMPGGTGGSYYLNSAAISGTAIRNFVASGKGYLGICAGAYSGCNYVKDWYYGWGVAPHVNEKHPWVEGPVPVHIESAGSQLFGHGGTITMAHYNGPAMYSNGVPIVTFATYADNSIGVQGLGAIVGDYYGLGRSVLSGVHPELSPKFPDILAKLTVWAANSSALNPPKGTVSISQICNAANSVKTYYETNHKLPTSITINGNQISMSQFLYLLSGSTVNVNNGVTSPITIKSINPPSAISGIFKAGNILKSEYLQIATNLINYMKTYGRAPNYIQTTLGNVPLTKLVYTYSKIMNFYLSNYRLPNYVSLSP